MNRAPIAAWKPVNRWLKWAFVIASILAFITGVQLFALTGQTDRYFSWTITSPLTAAFLGAAYWGNTLMFFLASRERLWAQVRVVVPSIFAFTLLIPIATFLHLNLFHLGSANPVTRALTWLWIGIYTALPPAGIALVAWQVRAVGGDPPRQGWLPWWMQLTLGLHAAVTGVFGLALFVVPQMVMPLWPWGLTPLTAQVVGAFLLTLSVTAAWALWENEWRRIRVAMTGYIALSLLYALALVRYGALLSWSRANTWLLLLFLLSLLVVGLYGQLAAQRVKHQAKALAPLSKDDG